MLEFEKNSYSSNFNLQMTLNCLCAAPHACGLTQGHVTHMTMLLEASEEQQRTVIPEWNLTDLLKFCEVKVTEIIIIFAIYSNIIMYLRWRTICILKCLPCTIILVKYNHVDIPTYISSFQIWELWKEQWRERDL